MVSFRLVYSVFLHLNTQIDAWIFTHVCYLKLVGKTGVKILIWYKSSHHINGICAWHTVPLDKYSSGFTQGK